MRAIHTIPDTTAQPWIEVLRRRFDPLAPLIAAHVTLLYPFDLQLSDQELVRHCQEQVSDCGAFTFTLGPPEKSDDDHFWLPVHPIPPALISLRNALLTGPLAGLISPNREYRPHITIARPPLNPEVATEIKTVAENLEFTLEATQITIERILDDGHSEVIERIAFQQMG